MPIPRKKSLKYVPPELIGLESVFIEPLMTTEEQTEASSVIVSDALEDLQSAIEDVESTVSYIQKVLSDEVVKTANGTISISEYSGTLLADPSPETEAVRSSYESGMDWSFRRQEFNFLEPLLYSLRDLRTEVASGLGYLYSGGTIGQYPVSVLESKAQYATLLAAESKNLSSKVKYYMRADAYHMAECLIDNLLQMDSSLEEERLRRAQELLETLKGLRAALEIAYVLKMASHKNLRGLLRINFSTWLTYTEDRLYEDVLGRAMGTIIESLRGFFQSFTGDTGCIPYNTFYKLLSELISEIIERQRVSNTNKLNTLDKQRKTLGNVVDSAGKVNDISELIRKVNSIITALEQFIVLGSSMTVKSLISSIKSEHKDKNKKLSDTLKDTKFASLAKEYQDSTNLRLQ